MSSIQLVLSTESDSVSQNAPLDLQLIWSRIDRGVNHGRNGLVKLAVHIFSVVANSAGCERVFSSFGITHTKLRNKLTPEKVHKSAVVGMEIKRVLEENGLARNRKKRKFGGDELVEASPSTLTDDVDSDAADLDFRGYAENLIRQAQISRQEDEREDHPIPPPVSQSVQPQPNTPLAPGPSSTSTSRKTQIRLADLFNYALDSAVGTGLGFYWPGSVKNLEEDLLAHERMAAEANTQASTSSTS